MKVDNLADLKALVKMCRKEGIASIEVDGVKLVLDEAPLRHKKLKTEEPENTKDMPAYTEEELLTWSANGQNY